MKRWLLFFSFFSLIYSSEANILNSRVFHLDKGTINSCQSWLEKYFFRNRHVLEIKKSPVACRLLCVSIDAFPNKEKIIYIEAQEQGCDNLRAYIFCEQQVDLIDNSESMFHKPMYMLYDSLVINDSKKTIHGIRSNVGSIPLINTKSESDDFIKYIREHYKNEFVSFQVSSSPKVSLLNSEKNSIVNLIKEHIINYDLKTAEVRQELGEIPSTISVTIAPFDRYDTYIRYIYTNLKPYRVMRTVFINADGKIDGINYFQSPGDINSPELQWIDYRYNSDGGPTLYESKKPFFDLIEENGIKLTISNKK